MNIPPRTAARTKSQITIRSFLLVMVLFGFSALGMSYLIRGASGNAEAMGHFTIVASVSPLVLLAGVSLFYRLKRWLRNS